MISILRQKIIVRTCLKFVGSNSYYERNVPSLGSFSGYQKLKCSTLYHQNKTQCRIYSNSTTACGYSVYNREQGSTSIKVPLRCMHSEKTEQQSKEQNGIDEKSSSTLEKERPLALEIKEYASILHDSKTLPEIQNDDIDITDLRPALPMSAGSLSAYVNESETLTNLISLGVDLSKIEKDKDLANLLLRMDFDTDVKPYILFLHHVGVQDTDLGAVINKNPFLFKDHVDDLQVRVNYLESKRFSKQAIARIVSMTPKILSMPTVEIDFQLGFIQKEFELTGAQVRTVLTSYPRIILFQKARLSENRIVYVDFLGFSKWELKKLLLTVPKVVTLGKHVLMERFDYLHNTMGISHQEIIAWPNILKSRLFITKQRYQFLKLVGRDQFDPKKENFVTMKALVTNSDAEFCAQVAKVPVQQFNDFLKTL